MAELKKLFEILNVSGSAASPALRTALALVTVLETVLFRCGSGGACWEIASHTALLPSEFCGVQIRFCENMQCRHKVSFLLCFIGQYLKIKVIAVLPWQSRA